MLSRMSGEIGVFLALTGTSLKSGDIRKVKISDGLIDDENYLKEHLIINMVNRDLSYSLNTSAIGGEKWEEKYNEIKNNKLKRNPHDINDVLTENGKAKLNFLDENFKEPYQYPWLRDQNENKGDFLTSPFTHIFNKEFALDQNKEEIKNSYRNYKRTYTNTFDTFEKQVLFGILENNSELSNLEAVYKQINKYFRFDSVKEIIEALEANSAYDEFAAQCLESMSQRSPLAMEVTLNLIRRAYNMNYEQCQRMEMNTAKNLILKGKDFDTYFENKGFKNLGKNKKHDKFEKDFSQDLVKEIIDSDSGTYGIELEIKRDAILPNKTYKNAFPDAFRLWINEHPRANKTIREFFDYEIKHYMIEKLGIDLRDSKITIDDVRKNISKIYANEFAKNKHDEKVYNLVSDSNFIDEYIKARKEFCDKYLSEADSADKIKSLITKKTKEIFEKSFTRTCSNILQKCKDIRDIDKRRTWQRLRKWLFINRIMTYKSKEKIIQNLRISQLGDIKGIYIPSDESVSWRDEINPEVKKSAFYQLAGLFNLKKISPEYALKFATTDTNSKALFEYLEINQAKLEEIRAIIKENPQKLVDIFDSALNKETEELFNSFEEKSLLEYDRLYRIRNDGKSPIDEFNFVNEFRALKAKWLSYKNNVLELLRKIVLDSVFKIIENPGLYSKNVLQASKQNLTIEQIKSDDKNNRIEDADLEQYKALFNLLKSQSDEIELFGRNLSEVADNTLAESDSLGLFESIKNSFVNSNEKVFSTIIANMKNEENELSKSFFNKAFELTKSLMLHYVLENNTSKKPHGNTKDSNTASNKPIKIEDFNTKQALDKLFSYENFAGEAHKTTNIEVNKFLHQIYLKYGSINVFKEALKSSKNTAIEILDQITENEISNHFNDLLKKVPENNINRVKAIYEKEKLLFEDLLKQYYEMRLNLNKLELIQLENASNSSTELPFEYNNIDYFISKLKDIAFSEFVLADRTQKCPINIDMLIKKDYVEPKNISEKRKQLVELYVTLKEHTINSDSQKALSTLTKSMKKSEWFTALEQFTNSSNGENLTEIINDYPKYSKIDAKLNDFMKQKFKDYIYQDQESAASEVSAPADKEVLNTITQKRFEEDFINDIITKYKTDKVSLNENIYDEGLMKKNRVVVNRNHLNKIKITLADKINEFLKNYNVNELTRKYVDIVYNKDFHLHRILCSIEEVQEFFSLNSAQEVNNLISYIKYGEQLLKFKKIINETKKKLFANSQVSSPQGRNSINSFSKLEMLKNISFNRKQYIQSLEKLSGFLKAREDYLNKIYNEFYGLFTYSEKYQLKTLASNIQADFAKLYNYLKENYLKNKNTSSFENLSQFCVADEDFVNNFGRLNFDEFFGVEGIDLIRNRIDFINNLKLQEQQAFELLDAHYIPEKDIKNIIRNLVVEEIAKSQKLSLGNEYKFDESLNLLLDKEHEIIKNLKENGFNIKNNSVTTSEDSLERKEMINDYKLKFKNFYSGVNNVNCASDANTCPVQWTSSENSAETNISKSLLEKVESKLFSLRQLGKISEAKAFDANNKTFKANLEATDMDINNNNSTSLEDFLSQYKDYGLKYNNVIKYMSGEKLSLRDMILNSYEKTLHDYNNTNEFEEIFTDKIPADIIKAAFDVLDAKLIKAVKLLNADFQLKNLSNPNTILTDILKSVKNDKAFRNEELKKTGNRLHEFHVHEEFSQLETFKRILEKRIKKRKNPSSAGASSQATEPVDKAQEQRMLRKEERIKKQQRLEDMAYAAIKRIYDLKKNPDFKLCDLENKKSIFDINIAESVRNDLIEREINQAKRKEKADAEKANAATNTEQTETLEASKNIQAEKTGKKEKQEFDPSKLTESELKAIYTVQIRDIVDIPDFRSKYSVLKYIYDYYMGTLAVDYDSHFQDAEERLTLINEASYLNRIEKSFYNYANLKDLQQGKGIFEYDYYEKIKKHNSLENPDLISFEKSDPLDDYKNTLFPYKEDRQLYDELPSEKEMKKLNHYRNVAFDFIKKNHPSRLFFPESSRQYLNIVKYEVDKFIENYHYKKLIKEHKKDEVYNNFSANLLTATEQFRAEASKTLKTNEKISSMAFNTNEVNGAEVGYSKLLNENSLNSNAKDNEFNKFIDKMFSNYLQVRKDKIAFTKAKLADVKQNLSHSGNLIMKTPYDLLKLSNQEYIEFKNYKDFESQTESAIIPDTTNPEAPIKLDLEAFIKSNSIQKEYPEFKDSDITNIVELDNALSFANFGKYCSIPGWIIDLADKEPEENYFEKYLNASPEKFVEFALEEIVEDFYLMRHQVEKQLSREELRNFDLENMEYFSFENISHLLKIKLNELKMNIHIFQDEAHHYTNNKCDEYIQKTKIKNTQFYDNQNIKDEDAFYRSVAYRIRLDKIKQDKISKHFKTTNSKSKKIPKSITHSLEDKDSFEFWYYSDLQNDKYRENPDKDLSYEQLSKKQEQKLFSYVNRYPIDENYLSNKKLENAKFLVEYGENNLDKSNKNNKNNKIITI